MGESNAVYEDVSNIFVEAFGGYNIPMDPYTCPFHPQNLMYVRDKMQLNTWKSTKNGTSKGKSFRCSICSKVFKSLDYYELHMKIHHSNISMTNYNYRLGQDNKPAWVPKVISRQTLSMVIS